MIVQRANSVSVRDELAFIYVHFNELTLASRADIGIILSQQKTVEVLSSCNKAAATTLSQGFPGMYRMFFAFSIWARFLSLLTNKDQHARIGYDSIWCPALWIGVGLHALTGILTQRFILKVHQVLKIRHGGDVRKQTSHRDSPVLIPRAQPNDILQT